jgi:hypothetical protein
VLVCVYADPKFPPRKALAQEPIQRPAVGIAMARSWLAYKVLPAMEGRPAGLASGYFNRPCAMAGSKSANVGLGKKDACNTRGTKCTAHVPDAGKSRETPSRAPCFPD